VPKTQEQFSAGLRRVIIVKSRAANPKPIGSRIVFASIQSNATGSTSALNPSGVASARNTSGTVTMASAAKARCRLAMNAASAPPFLAAVLIIIGAGGQATSIASPIATAGAG